MLIIKDANLSFADKKILTDVNITINSGDKYLLNQESGSGKTSLLKTLMGFIELDSGEIIINSNILSPSNINKIRSDIFYLDQDVTLPELNTLELFNQIIDYKNNKHINKKHNLQELLLDFRLNKNILDKNIKELSGGERQRIGLIIGLILNRPLWLLDEPTSALDKDLKEIVTNKINKLDITALIISHDSCWQDITTLDWSKK